MAKWNFKQAIDSFLQLCKGVLIIGFALIVFKIGFSLDFSKVNQLHVGSDGVTLTLNEYKALKKSSEDILSLANSLKAQSHNPKKQIQDINHPENKADELYVQAEQLNRQIEAISKMRS